MSVTSGYVKQALKINKISNAKLYVMNLCAALQ